MILLSRVSQFALVLLHTVNTGASRQHESSNLSLKLRPNFWHNHTLSSIEVRMVVSDFNIFAGEPLLVHHLTVGNAPTIRYTADDIDARDDIGPISLTPEDFKSELGEKRRWLPSRKTAGTITVIYTANVLPEFDENETCGPNVQLRAEGDGVQAPGIGFLILPTIEQDLHIQLSWNLTMIPPGFSTFSTLSEESRDSPITGAAHLDTVFFAVGRLHCFPKNAGSSFGLHWLSSPPFDTTELGVKLEHLASKMAAIFKDNSSTIDIFIHRSQTRCAAGTAFDRSFMFAWSPNSLDETHELDVFEFLAHEMVHNWPRLASSGDAIQVAWFNEGIAEYYSVVLPFRFGLYSKETFIRRLNLKMSAYYTNPAISMTNADVVKYFWTNNHANRVPYHRGLVYFMQLAAKLAARDKGLGVHDGLDLIITSIFSHRLDGQPVFAHDFLDIICEALGPEVAMRDFHAMMEGDIIVPSSDWFAPDYVLQSEYQEMFYLGFDESSLANSKSERVVTGLDPLSRAALDGGVCEGDVVSRDRVSFLWSAEIWGNNFTMGVKRTVRGLELHKELTWWPRSLHKVPSWQLAQASRGKGDRWASSGYQEL